MPRPRSRPASGRAARRAARWGLSLSLSLFLVLAAAGPTHAAPADGAVPPVADPARTGPAPLHRSAFGPDPAGVDTGRTGWAAANAAVAAEPSPHAAHGPGAAGHRAVPGRDPGGRSGHGHGHGHDQDQDHGHGHGHSQSHSQSQSQGQPPGSPVPAPSAPEPVR